MFGHSAAYPRQVKLSTIYDLASLTKVVATTTVVATLYQWGYLDLDTPVVHYLPDFNNHGKDTVHIRHLLLHNGSYSSNPP